MSTISSTPQRLAGAYAGAGHRGDAGWRNQPRRKQGAAVTGQRHSAGLGNYLRFGEAGSGGGKPLPKAQHDTEIAWFWLLTPG